MRPVLKAALFVAASPLAATAAECVGTFEVTTSAAHGSLPAGTVLAGEIAYDEGRSMRMGEETVSYLSTGTLKVSAPDGTAITAALRVIHMTRTPWFADWASFDAKDVAGDLGSVTDYEDPLLLSLYAPRGSLASFELPRDTAGWEALSDRRDFQVHTPDTMWTLPGEITSFEIDCG
ncbi:MAG: hypothetical protein AAFN79_03210 [Pseudomonadota bacterium]